jgi:hypothetical protein
MSYTLAVTLLSSCVAWSTSGCATILNPGPDIVPVSSRPSGAVVRLDGTPVGRTPVLVAVPRSSEGVFTLELPGYETKKVDRDKVFNGMLCMNLLWIVVWPAVPVAIGVDLIAGNAGKYSTQPLNVELTPVAAPRN